MHVHVACGGEDTEDAREDRSRAYKHRGAYVSRIFLSRILACIAQYLVRPVRSCHTHASNFLPV